MRFFFVELCISINGRKAGVSVHGGGGRTKGNLTGRSRVSLCMMQRTSKEQQGPKRLKGEGEGKRIK
jgi:hypothetical protein